jgi:hypothetical protein
VGDVPAGADRAVEQRVAVLHVDPEADRRSAERLLALLPPPIASLSMIPRISTSPVIVSPI